MKKCILMLVMMFTMSVYSFAEGNVASNIPESKKYELKVNNRKLAYVLDMSEEQFELSQDIISELESDMEFAKSMVTEDSRNIIMANALRKNIDWMHYVLDNKQYKKYLMLLNLTLHNRGFDVVNINSMIK